ncbi:MAG TPA: hypothetical protein VG963_03250 [Polyangiaceae bacterium]|nr:hypothetical protein [Polyangiaceae bacterium]
MNANRLRKRLLAILFVRSQNNETTHIFDLAESSGASCCEVLLELRTLDRGGLIDGRRLRLTLRGLAVASALVRPSRREPAPERRRSSAERLPPPPALGSGASHEQVAGALHAA